MPIAGGSANWSRRTNWYSGSECNRPKRTAHLTTSAPEIGKIIYRTATIPIITLIGTFDPFKPEDINGDRYFHHSTIRLVKEGRILTKIKRPRLPSRRFAPMIKVIVGMADSLQTWKECQGKLVRYLKMKRTQHFWLLGILRIIRIGYWPEQVRRVFDHTKRGSITNYGFLERRDDTNNKSNNL